MSEPEHEHIPAAAPKHERVGPNYHKNDSKLRRILIYLVIVVLLTGGVYWFFLRSKPAPDKNASTSQATKTSQPASQFASTTKNYSSSNFALAFDYPQDWTVADNGGGILTVTSPSMKLKDANGKSMNGKIVLTIRDKAQKLAEFDAGSAAAVKESNKVAYTKPSQTQRGSTYLSFLQYAKSPHGGLDGVYITGDNGYAKDQDIPKVDITKVDPVTSITFSSDDKPLTIQASSWEDHSFSDPLENILKSLSIT